MTVAAQSKGSWSGPTIAMTMVAACLVMTDQMAFAEVAPAKRSTEAAKRTQANVQDLVKSVVGELRKLEADMSKYTRILCEKDVPEGHLEDHPFGLIADTSGL